jgi:hypothetical protein
MTEDGFLKRWSRRKRKAADVAKPAAPETDVADAKPASEDIVAPEATPDAQPEFDVASLPPIDSITAMSDVTAFLRAGVPAELTRAALRRVWTADPAIRNFVGLAENAWDFTDPNAMPGFGPLESTDEVRRMIAKVIDGIGKAAQPPEAEVAQNSNDSNAMESAKQDAGDEQLASAPDQPSETVAENSGNQVLLQGNREDVAMQYDAAEGVEKTKQPSPRIHGSALPR